MSDQERSTAKVICLGIIYGMGPHAAAAKLNIEGYSHPLNYSDTLWQFLCPTAKNDRHNPSLPITHTHTHTHTYTRTRTRTCTRTRTHTIPYTTPSLNNDIISSFTLQSRLPKKSMIHFYNVFLMSNTG